MPNRSLTCLIALCLCLIKPGEAADLEDHKIVRSPDGTLISSQASGQGNVALVFVHGWSCDARYWDVQARALASDYQIVQLDLAGHGHSQERPNYSLTRFADDVAAVVKQHELTAVILIGHSMGGIISGFSAAQLPEHTLGVIAVDALTDITYAASPQDSAEMVAPFSSDFAGAMNQFLADMFLPGDDTGLRKWVTDDMQSALPSAAIASLNALMLGYQDGSIRRTFGELSVPVRGIDSDRWPVNVEGNQTVIDDYAQQSMEHTDHFLMISAADRFTPILKAQIESIISATR
jgi:pimeloyl-ACP methyl ester carboxylesterase